MGVAALAVPLLIKTVWPYYYLEPFIFLLVWEFTSMHDRRAGIWRWPMLTLGYLVVAATLSPHMLWGGVGACVRLGVGLLELGPMLALVGALWLQLHAARGAAG